jgi:DNA-directed RNA polymerase subunit RPC12/RpoP
VGSLDRMADGETPETGNEIVCPHCKKPFKPDLIAGSAERYRGFKCPHCRLFVPAARIKA